MERIVQEGEKFRKRKRERENERKGKKLLTGVRGEFYMSLGIRNENLRAVVRSEEEETLFQTIRLRNQLFQ